MVVVYHQNTEKYQKCSLKRSAKEFLGREMIEFTELFTSEELKRVNRKKPILKLNTKSAAHCLAYACSDAINTWLLYKSLRHKIHKRIETVYDIDTKFIDYILDMQEAGFSVDEKYISELRNRLQEQVSRLQDRLDKAAGFPVNPDASASVWTALKSFGVEPTLFTATGKPSYSADTLETIDHPFAKSISDYRMLTKLISTFIDALEAGRHPKTGKCHSMYPYTFTSTGRLSSTKHPTVGGINAQQVAKAIIPDKNHELFQAFKSDSIRKAIVPPKGYIMASLDWSAVELRIAAHFSQEPIWLEGFKNNEDLHQKLADNINAKLGLNIDRSKAKNAQFNMLYAFSWYMFSQHQGISMEEAESLYRAFFGTVVHYDRWREAYRNQAFKLGYAETLFGRRRVAGSYTEAKELYEDVRKLDKKYKDFDESEKLLWKKYRKLRTQGDRESVNHRIQGTCLDIMKIAGIKIRKDLIERGLWMKDVIPMMVVHDEIDLAIRGEIISTEVNDKGETVVTVSPEAEKIIRDVKKIMETAAPKNFSVPLICDAEAGKNWKELYKIKL